MERISYRQLGNNVHIKYYFKHNVLHMEQKIDSKKYFDNIQLISNKRFLECTLYTHSMEMRALHIYPLWTQVAEGTFYMKSPVSKTLCFHLHFSSVVCKEDQFVLVLSGLSTKYIFTFLKQYMICIWFLGRHFNDGRPIVCVQAGHHVHTVQHRQAGRSFSSSISFW